MSSARISSVGVPLPRYAFVPGLAPHPRRNAAEHQGVLPEDADPSLVWAYGVDLFRHGFPWEAHEAWERLWKAAPEGAPEKAALKGLIQLAAVLVTLELGHTDAATRLATRGAKLIGDAAVKRPELNGIALRRLSEDILAWARRGFPCGAWPRTCDFELTGRPAP